MNVNASCFETIWEDGAVIDTLEYDLSRLEFICENSPYGKMTDFAVSDMGCPIVSQRLKDTFEDYGIDNITFYLQGSSNVKELNHELGFTL